MSEQDTPGSDMAETDDFGSGAVRLDQGHIEGTSALPARFDNPGLPTHVPRMADTDPKAAKRAERQVATLFGLSIIGTVAFIIAYYAVDEYGSIFVPGIGQMRAYNLALGVTLAIALLGIGFGAVHWAKTLMPDEEIVELRHPMRSSDEARADFVDTLYTEGDKAQLARRPMLKWSFVGAMALFPLTLTWQLVGSLGRLPHDELALTFWNGPVGEDGKPTFTPMRLVRDPENTPIKASDLTIGSVVHVQPEGLLDLEHGVLEEKGKASVLLMRLDPNDIKIQREREWGYQGIVAYSKICTHVGCPVGLYEQQTHHLLCPCHQSTFDVTDDCRVIFGPAKRPLPQLPITVDDEGYLVSKAAFAEPVGPSYWEREKQ